MTERMTVLGTGYLGATHAAGMAELGHEVLGVDVDVEKIARLAAGDIPFFEPGLEELVRRHLASGRLRFTTDMAEAAEFATTHFVGVGTPQKKDSFAADMRYLDQVIETLGPLLTRPSVIFGKSTVPVGTAARLTARLRVIAPAGDQVDLAWNPEFLREGLALQDTLHPDRIVLGIDAAGPRLAEDVARRVYRTMLDDDTPFLVTDLQTAELVKVAANAFLATKISFINAMAEVCEAAGADVSVLADAIGHDVRIGRRFLNAGLGFGGGCLPKDIRAFMARAGELGVDQALTFLREVDAVNERRRGHAVNLAREASGGSLLGARVAVLGAAFKPDSDDVRDSPALDIASRIAGLGAHVTVTDPAALDNVGRSRPDLRLADSAMDAAAGADLVLLLTEWREFVELDPETLGGVVHRRVIIDGRNVLDPRAWRRSGWAYHGLGRP